MRRGQPDWEDLRCFAAVVRHGGLSAAARALGVAHTTIARRLNRLEQAVETALFDRADGGFALTAAGRRALDSVAEMEKAAHGVQPAAFVAPETAVRGLVRLTLPRTLADVWLAPRLGELAQRHPGVDLILLAEFRNLSLARREADVALRLLEPADGDFIARRLCQMAYGLYAAPELAARLAAGEPPAHISYIDPALPESRWLRQAAPAERVALRTDSLLAQVAACQAGVGLALLPRYIARNCGGLVEQPPPAPLIRRGIWLLTRRDQRRAEPARAVADFLTDLLDRERPVFEDD